MTFLCHSFEAIVMCVWICFRAAWLSSYPGAIKERNCSPQLIGRAWLQLPSQQQRNVCAASESPKNAKQQQSACENRYSYGYMHQHWIKDCVIPYFIFRSINDFLSWTFGALTNFLLHSEFLRFFHSRESKIPRSSVKYSPLPLPLVESIEAVRCLTGGVDLLDKEKSLASGSTGLMTK